ncbi:MAG TPA: thioredoxin [Candidatus Lachnoclostridium stercoravium]|uniref:Thioredoxin n=1 Tax=Candidatus Lachnoclostridium stercoravium TaxID=2838633 RepID=A0A9D2KP48_9FIRM|nr:thioredoxin [Candidatus Lachnoclostridium stercoravium]
MVQVFTTENFDSEVLKSDIPVLVDFYADWCGPCKMMAPVVEKIDAEYGGKVKVGKINVDENPEIAGNYGVMTIPTIMVIKGGQVVEKTIGVQPKKALTNAIDKAL